MKDQIEEGRLSRNSEGLGTVTEAMVRDRAREIAVINGRDESQVLDADFQQARRELQGHERLYPNPTPAENLPESDRWNPVASTPGHKAKTMFPPDEQTMAQQLVEEGVADAEHDQQVEAIRESRRRDDLS